LFGLFLLLHTIIFCVQKQRTDVRRATRDCFNVRFIRLNIHSVLSIFRPYSQHTHHIKHKIEQSLNNTDDDDDDRF
jgi:hypothetical protein